MDKVITLYRPADFTELDEHNSTQSLNFRKKRYKGKVQLQKSLAMFVILDFLPPKTVIRLQALSHRMYDSILPLYLYSCTIAEDRTRDRQVRASNFLNFAEDSENFNQIVFMAQTGLYDSSLSWKTHDRALVWDPEYVNHIQADRDNFASFKSNLRAFRGFRFVYANEVGSKIYACGGLLSEDKTAESKELHIGTSPCFELQAGGKRILRRANMTTQRQYMCAVCLHPKTRLGQPQPRNEFYPRSVCESEEIYCIGGKAKFVMLKTIEKYRAVEDRWVEIKTQLNYARYFPTCTAFGERLIYIFGQLTDNQDTDHIELLDTRSEFSKIKCELICLNETFIPPPVSLAGCFDDFIIGGAQPDELQKDIQRSWVLKQEYSASFKEVLVPLEKLFEFGSIRSENWDVASYVQTESQSDSKVLTMDKNYSIKFSEDGRANPILQSEQAMTIGSQVEARTQEAYELQSQSSPKKMVQPPTKKSSPRSSASELQKRAKHGQGEELKEGVSIQESKGGESIDFRASSTVEQATMDNIPSSKYGPSEVEIESATSSSEGAEASSEKHSSSSEGSLGSDQSPRSGRSASQESQGSESSNYSQGLEISDNFSSEGNPQEEATDEESEEEEGEESFDEEEEDQQGGLKGEQKTMVAFFEGCQDIADDSEAQRQLLVELLAELEKPKTRGKFLVFGRHPVSDNQTKQDPSFWKKNTIDFSIIDMDEGQVFKFIPRFLPRSSLSLKDVEKSRNETFECSFCLRSSNGLQILGADHLYEIPLINAAPVVASLLRDLDPLPWNSFEEQEVFEQSIKRIIICLFLGKRLEASASIFFFLVQGTKASWTASSLLSRVYEVVNSAEKELLAACSNVSNWLELIGQGSNEIGNC